MASLDGVARMIEHEKVKLKANYLNGLAIAVFAIGGLAPLAALAYQNSNGGRSSTVIIGAALCFVGSFALHFVAVRTLGGLKDE